ncbi:hypothetical protein ACQP3J_29805, partial [Escherichia coli]
FTQYLKCLQIGRILCQSCSLFVESLLWVLIEAQDNLTLTYIAQHFLELNEDNFDLVLGFGMGC